MLDAIRKRRESEEGFTLIELMVVVLIIAILLAIAIPTFLGAQNRAKDRAAQSDLRNSLTAAKTLATDQEGFFKKVAGTPPVDTALAFGDLNAAETSIDHAAAPTTNAVGVSVETPDGADADTSLGSWILLVKQSKASDNLFWGILATKDGDVTYCKGTTAAALTSTSCTSDSFSAAPTL